MATCLANVFAYISHINYQRVHHLVATLSSIIQVKKDTVQGIEIPKVF